MNNNYFTTNSFKEAFNTFSNTPLGAMTNSQSSYNQPSYNQPSYNEPKTNIVKSIFFVL
jgi:hypothetical protein